VGAVLSEALDRGPNPDRCDLPQEFLRQVVTEKPRR
jgi:hypothetical protein